MKDDLVILLEKFLQHTATPEEISRLSELFGMPESRKILDDYYATKWAQEHSSVEREAEERMLANLRKQIVRSTPKLPVWKRVSRAAAAVLVPLLAAGTLYFYFDARSYKHSGEMAINVDIGQKADMVLPDGTHVWLNSASHISYDNGYNRKERILELQGEAYFEVKKDSRRPFIVQAEGVSVEALGTSFNVKAYPEDDYITTTLIEGSVRVSDLANSDIMKPNEQLIVTKADRRFTKNIPADAARLIGWRDNILAFERETLGEIAKILERMYSIDIVFEHEDLKQIRFTGKIKNNNLESVLQLISITSPIEYSADGTTIYIKENIREKHLYKRIP